MQSIDIICCMDSSLLFSVQSPYALSDSLEYRFVTNEGYSVTLSYTGQIVIEGVK